jgi:hypothetical protein
VDDEDSLQYCKAVYQYSYIPRRIVKTRKGYHIYFPTLPPHFTLRVLFGDDERRLEYDYYLYIFKCPIHINVAFKSTEMR